ncbi:MAG: hypothetical protein NTU79_02940, partial [Planctomycetota bacterium]|nr:hypothetical protein [Planctomycetota bacterium]
PSMKVTIPWGNPKGIQCMPSGFMPVVIDLRPSMKVTIPWDKPKGIQCMPSGFTPVVVDLRPSVKVMIPSGKPVQRLIFTHISGHRKSVVFPARAQSEGRCSCKKEVGKARPWIHERARSCHAMVTRRLSEEPTAGPSLTYRVMIGSFQSAARLRRLTAEVAQAVSLR